MNIKKLYRKVGTAITDYNMIKDGDKILVALSGGKDSFTMLDTLHRLQKRAPVKFSILACTVNPGFPEFSTEYIETWLNENKIAYHIEKSNIYYDVFNDREKSKDGCFFCSRQRRSILYRVADRKKCNKIALGHHREDFIESVFMSMMYNGIIETMLPVFTSDSKRFQIIRPLVYIEEELTENYSILKNFPLTSCACPALLNGNLRRKKNKNDVIRI